MELVLLSKRWSNHKEYRAVSDPEQLSLVEIGQTYKPVSTTQHVTKDVTRQDRTHIEYRDTDLPEL